MLHAHDDPLSSDPYAALSDSLRALAMRGVVRLHPKGTLLIHEGDDGGSLFIILSGSLRAFGTGSNGREITYGTYHAGDYVGEMSLDGGPRSASVATLEPSRCVLVTRETLRQHFAAHPDFAFELLERVIRRARAATLTVKQLALSDVYDRLVQLLEGLAETQPDGTGLIREPLTQQEIANRLGCSREMVSRLVRDLRTGGYLDVSGRLHRLIRKLPRRW